MKRYVVLIFISFLFSQQIFAEILWANKLLSYSSQFDEKAYSAKQALGPPSKLPSLGDCGCAWTTSIPNNNMEEFIRVGFVRRIKVRQVIISENFNAGAIKAIYLYDQYNIPHLVYERTKIHAEYGRVFTFTIPETDFETNELKLVLDTESIPGYNQIDAIGISEIVSVLEAKKINITDRIEFKGNAKRMESGINTVGSDLTPLISPDGKTLYFTRKEDPNNMGSSMNDDIWITRKTGNKWSTPENAGTPLNNDNNNYVIGISADGKMLSLANTYNPGGNSLAGIAQSWMSRNNSWKYPVNLITPGILTYNFYVEYYMSTDRSVLLMALEKGDSYGIKDIYVSFSANEVVWTEPLNLGPIINTVSNEMAPFLAQDGKLLFFSSDGMPGYGEQDIYVSYRLDDTWTNWSKPENLGPKINSDGFDAYFSFSDSSYYAYFTSTRDEYFNPDIYQIPLREIIEIEDTIPEEIPLVENNTGIEGSSIIDTVIVINDEGDIEEETILEELKEVDIDLTNDYLLFGTIFDASTELPVDAQLIFKFNKYIGDPETMNTLNKNYRKKITGNISYKVIILKKGYLYKEEIITITDFNTQKVKRVDFRLDPIKKGEKFVLNNLYFDANSAKIKTGSDEQLDILYEFLKINPDISIEIGGHTNGLCDDTYCSKLSESRAIEVMKYLKEMGIAEERLQAIGYGKYNPVSSNETTEGRRKNQRVEIKIL
ncbi:MAG: PD40 domain-containing protein [Fimbriimonadaceae bacterium]|nr:PD40 domain-containing protein [Chitinophagales bacterium]